MLKEIMKSVLQANSLNHRVVYCHTSSILFMMRHRFHCVSPSLWETLNRRRSEPTEDRVVIVMIIIITHLFIEHN